LTLGNGWILEEFVVSKPSPIIPVTSTTIVECPFKFSNHDLARRVRAHMYILLEKFDLDKNLTFDET
jgi:hypothetical protein